MQITTRRFGPIEVADDSIVAVPKGIPGFPDLHQVVLLGAGTVPGHPEPDTDHAMFWMQSVDDGDLAFLCIVPWTPFPDYDLEIDEAELGIADAEDVRILNLVTVRREDGAAHLTANLRAPLVVDVAARRMHQVILQDARWSVHAPFAVKTSTEVR